MRLNSVGVFALTVLAMFIAGCGAIGTSRPAYAGARILHTNFAAMPEPVTSFGAVTAGDWLYVFGGHTGKRHEYSAEKVSGSFHRLRLSDGRAWEELPAAAPGQGLALVSHGRHIYRVGGMAARNPAAAKQDLYSTTLVQRFDPRRGEWQDFVALPAPRSSHDAVVVGNKIYVAGGWQLTGAGTKTVWPATALVLDLDNPHAGWREFSQPFQRRALAMAAVGTRIFCIGGMNDDNEATLAVDIFNTTTGEWTKGPDLPGGRHKGFSCSAVPQAGRVYVSAFKGELLRLSPDERSWEILSQLQHRRMSHRLVAAGDGQLIALGGEDGQQKRPELELLTPATIGKAAAQTADVRPPEAQAQ